MKFNYSFYMFNSLQLSEEEENLIRGLFESRKRLFGSPSDN